MRALLLTGLILGGVVLLFGGVAFSQWGTPVRLSSNINTDSTIEQDPFITVDGQKLYFISNRAGSLDIWLSTWDSAQNDWGVPEWIGPPVSTVNDDYSPSVSPDGKKLYFLAFGAGWDVWCSNWDSINQRWGVPQNMGPNINSQYLEWSPKISADGKKLYYSTEGRGHTQGQAAFTATYNDSLGWQPPVPFPDWINNSGTEEGAYVSPDENDLLFARWLVGGPGGLRKIFWSQWDDTNWSVPIMLDTSINKYTAWSPFLGPDGRLYFAGAPESGPSTDIWVAERIATGVEESKNPTVPRTFELYQNYPNPFNSGTVISYSLSRKASVRLEIFNIIGKRIKVLIEAEQSAGTYRLHWNGTDSSGKMLPSGIYIYRLAVGDEAVTQKMVFL